METLPIALVGLALLDSTSFGTLLIPVWLLVTPGRIRAGRIITYLGTVTTFYFCVGILLMVGAGAALEALHDAFAGLPTDALRAGQLALGVLIIAVSYWLEARARRHGDPPGKVRRWRTRAMAGTGSGRGLMSLAVAAAARSRRCFRTSPSSH
jgi:Sap, sulfolipid-1-addressing protein